MEFNSWLKNFENNSRPLLSKYQQCKNSLTNQSCSRSQKSQHPNARPQNYWSSLWKLLFIILLSCVNLLQVERQTCRFVAGNFQLFLCSLQISRYFTNGSRTGSYMLPAVLHPKSRGSIRLASADPLDRPHIDPNMLADPYDREVMRAGELQRIS